VHRVWVPHLNRTVVIGGMKLPSPHAPMLRLSSYLDKGTLPPMIQTVDWSAPAMSVIENVEGNDSLGDCVLAEEAHFIGVVTGNAGTLYSYTQAQTIAAYSAITGYNPANPSSDQGTDPTVCMNYFTQNPYADGSKLDGWVSVDATSVPEVQFAIGALGNLKIWLSLPDVYINPFPSSNGFVWDVATPNPSQGHCIGSPAYNSPRIVGSNSNGVQIMTWGLIGTMTWSGLARLCAPLAGGGLAVRLTRDWMNKANGNTPAGFAYADLVSDVNKFFNSNISAPPAIAPPKPPLPTPAPAGSTVTLGLAQEWAALGIQQGDPLQDPTQAAANAAAGLAAGWPTS
jgi:hypothetical protein